MILTENFNLLISFQIFTYVDSGIKDVHITKDITEHRLDSQDNNLTSVLCKGDFGFDVSSKELDKSKKIEDNEHEEVFDEQADPYAPVLETEVSNNPIEVKIEENSSKEENTKEGEGCKQNQTVQFWNEDVWAVDQINSATDINWFEMEHVKEYYTQQGGEILKKFIEKYRMMRKAETEKERELRLAKSAYCAKVIQNFMH